MAKLQGVLFDMDGVLFDTETQSIRISEIVMREMGYTADEQFFIDSCGMNDTLYHKHMLDAFGADFAYDEYLRLFREKREEEQAVNGVPKMKGVDMLLRYLADNGYRTAIASSTQCDRIRLNLERAGITHEFDAVIGGDLVSNSKPHPEIFEMAAAAIGLETSACLAVEDSANGIRSAAAAGCVTVMVPDVTPANDELRALSAAVLASLEDIPAFLEKLAAQ